MKRSECSIERLKALGYKAKCKFTNAWRFYEEEKDCNEKQSKELFKCVVSAVRNGGEFEIRQNNANYTVNVLLNSTRHEYRGTETVYYLSRPMTEAERLEADLYTGRNK